METNINKDLGLEREIDLIDLGKQLWAKRKFILKAASIGFIVGVVIAFSIPKEYTTTVILAPEVDKSSSIGSVGALAAMAGVNIGGATTGQMSLDLYPSIAKSTPFIIGLFNVEVKDTENGVSTSLYSYINDEQKAAWWSKIRGLPGGIIGLFRSKESIEKTDRINNFALTGEQTQVLNTLRDRIVVTVEKKTNVIMISSTMQSPEVSASVADTLTSYLQSYIINYRTEKARQDLIFTEKLCAEAKKDYSDAQQRYARYLDENQNIILDSYKVNQEKLQNEMTLTYGVYNQMAQQVQMAKVKVQDTTPVYTIIQPAAVPLVPVSPNKRLIIIGFLFLSTLGAFVWIIGKNFYKK